MPNLDSSGDDFVILLKTLSIELVKEYREFKSVDTIADISEQEYLQYKNGRVREGNLIPGQQQTSKKHGSKIESETRRTVEKKTVLSGPSYLKPPRKLPQQTSRYQPAAKSVQFAEKLGPDIKHNSFRPKKSDLQKLGDIKPLVEELNDLIPPDTDALGLDMDNWFSSATNDDSDYDSVSCSSSEESFFTCNEELEKPVIIDITPQIGRPGIKLDPDVIAPPSKEVLATLPVMDVFHCKRENCGFTTSNATHIRLHSCTRTHMI